MVKWSIASSNIVHTDSDVWVHYKNYNSVANILDSSCKIILKIQTEPGKGCASETSVIHSHLMLTFAWCFSIASMLGPSSKQKQIFASLLYKRLTWRTPNSSVGDTHNSFKFASLKGTLWTSKNTGIYIMFSGQIYKNSRYFKCSFWCQNFCLIIAWCRCSLYLWS